MPSIPTTLEKKQDVLCERLMGILSEFGPHDFESVSKILFNLMILEFPPAEEKERILESFSGPWENYCAIWRAFYIFQLSKHWRKFERIAKKFPGTQEAMLDLACEEVKLGL